MKNHWIYLFRRCAGISAVVLAAAGFAADPGVLEQGFAQPPSSAGIRCWWWWLNGNVTKAAITRDLEEMKAKGFSGACIFDAGGAEQRGNNQVPAGPLFGSPEWRALYQHAIREADRLGLVMSLSIQSGWNLGGPTVTPAAATKHLTWSEARVRGPLAFKEKLPDPKSRDGFYRDIAVLAFKQNTNVTASQAEVTAASAQAAHPAAHATDGSAETFWVSNGAKAGEGPTPERPQWIQFKLASPANIAGLRVLGRAGYSPKDCVVQVSDDGRQFRTVAKLAVADGKETTAHFTAEPASFVRLLIHSAYDRSSPNAPRNVQVAEIALLDANDKLVGGGQVRRPIRDLIDKAVFHEVGGSAPDTRHLLDDYEPQPGEEDARLHEIVNLTDRLSKEGRLEWAAPGGDWVVLRFGYTCSGARVSTSSGQWQGRVIDHMSADIFRAYWNQHIEPMLRDIGPLAGKTLKFLQTDSWELGGINWTDNFAAEFKQRRGYDLTPYLPIIAGKIIESRNVCNRFLADFRKTIGDCVSDNHYGVFAELARQHGIGLQPESAGPHAGPFDGLKNYGHSAIMMSEFWVPSPHRPRPENRFFVKQASSAAHIYNRSIVGAEAFTSIGPHWNDTLWSAHKPSFDHEVCSGLNLVLLHTFTCSPAEMGLPGQEYFAGTHFNPNVTWWEMSGEFIRYLSRVQFLMQQGQFVADALYYYGDHVPNIARLKEDDPAKVLPGYDYDVINEDRLMQLSVRNGRLLLPHGMGYRVLALPDHKVLSLAALKKVHELVRAGATVIGPRTERIVSLENFPACDGELLQLAGELWGQANAAEGENRFGKGRVIWGKTAQAVLQADGIPPDFEVRGAPASPPQGKWVVPDYDYIHHSLGDLDYYFVCNQTAAPQKIEAMFRIAGKEPELWDPVTGARRVARAFRQEHGRTAIPVEFAPYGSLMVVFRQPIPVTQHGEANRNYPALTRMMEITGNWQVHFDPKWGGPATAQFAQLTSWTQRAEPGIKYYSGAATYRINFDCAPAAQTRRKFWLDLGDLRDVGMARVRLNGQDCGVTWCPPFRVEVTHGLRAQANELEIAVVNSWRNRLLGDRDLPPDRRVTKTNIRVRPDWALVESGLLGPVTVLAADGD